MTSRLEDIVAAFTDELADATVTIAIGRRELARNNAPPRIVFERFGGPIEMTREIGRQDTVEDTTGTRQLYQRNFTVKMHCWGATGEQTEQLMHNAIVAMRRAALGSVVPGNEEWTEIDDGDTNYGDEVVVDLALQIPVIDELLDLKVPDTWNSTGTFGDTEGACGSG